MAGKPTLFAADTNFLLDLADGEEVAADARDVIKRRVPGALILVPPTVIDELSWGVQNWTGKKQQLAYTALTKLKSEWGFQPVDLIPAGHGIVELDAAHFTAVGLISENERNDSFIIAESALLGCAMLISSDHHLCDIDHQRLQSALREKDLSPLLVKSPRDIVKTFWGKTRHT
jgi:predicted nucleic acid-binding protein